MWTLFLGHTVYRTVPNIGGHSADTLSGTRGIENRLQCGHSSWDIRYLKQEFTAWTLFLRHTVPAKLTLEMPPQLNDSTLTLQRYLLSLSLSLSLSHTNTHTHTWCVPRDFWTCPPHPHTIFGTVELGKIGGERLAGDGAISHRIQEMILWNFCLPNHRRWYAEWKLSWIILHNASMSLHAGCQFVCSVGAY